MSWKFSFIYGKNFLSHPLFTHLFLYFGNHCKPEKPIEFATALAAFEGTASSNKYKRNRQIPSPTKQLLHPKEPLGFFDTAFTIFSIFLSFIFVANVKVRFF